MLLTNAWISFCLFTAEVLNPVPIILDTDIGPDCDDAGAMAVLHVLANNNEAEILGIMCCTSSQWGAPCIDAINTYYGRGYLPVGTYKKSGFLTESKYNQYLGQHFPRQLKNGQNATDARKLYRQVLASQPDKSVVICAIGPLNNLKDLLQTKADQYSQLNGYDLVLQKVNAIYIMGGQFPNGLEWNFQQDSSAAQMVVRNWPTSIIFCGFEIGEKIMTGNRLCHLGSEDHPVRKAYQLHTQGEDRPSWDPATVLCAVRGSSEYWTVESDGICSVDSDGSNQWRTLDKKSHHYLKQRMDPLQLATVIEELMLQPPMQ